jgi:cytochrome c oxidase cbb3-type subunit 1
LAWVVAIGWQIGVAVGVASLLMGYTSTKEYAEFEWPVDIAVAIVWGPAKTKNNSIGVEWT